MPVASISCHRSGNKKRPENRTFLRIGAEEGIRTPTILRSPAPQAGASAVPPLPRRVESQSIRILPAGAPNLFLYFGLCCGGLSGVVGAGVAGLAGAAGFGALAGARGDAPPPTQPGPRRLVIARALAPLMNNAPRTPLSFASTPAPAPAPHPHRLLPP